MEEEVKSDSCCFQADAFTDDRAEMILGRKVEGVYATKYAVTLILTDNKHVTFCGTALSEGGTPDGLMVVLD